MGSVAHVKHEKNELARDAHRLAWLRVHLVDSLKGVVMVQPNSKFSLVVYVKAKQHCDPILIKLKDSLYGKSIEAFSQGGDDILRYQGKLCIPDVDNLKRKIFGESHSSRYFIHRVPPRCIATCGRSIIGMI